MDKYDGKREGISPEIFVRFFINGCPISYHIPKTRLTGTKIWFELEETFFKRLRKILKPDSELMVIDSIWSRRRQQYRQKEGVQERSLNDGRAFTIYKRYLSESDIEETLLRHHFQLDSYREGDAWFTAICVKANKDID